MVRYFKADSIIIRAYSLLVVLTLYPTAQPISREQAAAHDAKGGAITWVLG